MANIKISDLENCVDLSEDEAQTINGGSKLSSWLHKHLGLPEIKITLIPTNTTPDSTGTSN